jgi:hypothetical protein
MYAKVILSGDVSLWDEFDSKVAAAKPVVFDEFSGGNVISLEAPIVEVDRLEQLSKSAQGLSQVGCVYDFWNSEPKLPKELRAEDSDGRMWSQGNRRYDLYFELQHHEHSYDSLCEEAQRWAPRKASILLILGGAELVCRGSGPATLERHVDAFEFAMIMGRTEMAEHILKHEIDEGRPSASYRKAIEADMIMAVDAHGRARAVTPLQYATQRGYQKVAQLLKEAGATY